MWDSRFTYATRVWPFFYATIRESRDLRMRHASRCFSSFFSSSSRDLCLIYMHVREIRYSSDYLISMVLSSFNFSCIVSQMNDSSRRMELREIVGRDFSRREYNNETDFAKLNIASDGYLYGKIEISRERKIQNCNCDFCVWSFHHRADFLRIELTKRKTNVKQIVQSDPDLCPLVLFFFYLLMSFLLAISLAFYIIFVFTY